MVTKKNILDIIGAMYMSVLLVALVESFVVIVWSPFGSVPIYGQFSIRAITLLTFSGSTLFLYLYYSHVWVIPRILCSLSLPVLGMAFHEALWHLGYRIIWGGGFIEFWTLYSIAIGVGTYILHKKWNILNLKPHVLFVLCCLVILTTFDWLRYTYSGFYQTLLLYEQDLAPNPHTLTLYASATLSRIFWTLLARGGKKNE